MSKFLLICFFSVICQAQSLKVGAPAFFPAVWTAGREILKTISEAVANTQKIEEETQKREAAIQILAPQKSHLETVLEREKRIKALREEMIEARHYRQAGSKSAQELETELLELEALGLRPDEDSEDEEFYVEIPGTHEPLLLQKSAKISPWQVPGMLMAPAKVAPGSSGGGQGSAQEAPAPLKPQETAKSCEVCKKEFGLTRWKYNCRTCGEVVCHDCSPREFKTAGYPTPQRICKTCEQRQLQRQKARPEAQRIDELCDEFTTQANQDTSTRDRMLAVAGTVLGGLSSVVPSPFDSVVSAAAKVVSLAQTAATNTAESQRLAARVARLNMAMMKLVKEGDSPLAQRAAKDLKKVFDDAIKLLQKFQPDASRTFMERMKVTWKQYSSSTAEEFNALHAELTMIITDRAFAVSAEDQKRLRAPTVQEIKESVRQELLQVTEEVKRQGLETGQRLVQIEESLQQLLDKSYGGASGRAVVLLDPDVVQVDSTRILGEGAFGVIRPGLLYNSIPVAVKELAHCSGDMAAALQQEVERLTRVSHPNVVKVYGLLTSKDKKTPCAIVMERLGASLESVSQQQTLTPEQKMKYTSDIMAGMGRVHDGRVVHCDLKPANVLLTENRHSAKLIDFGLSQGRSTIIFTDIPRSRGTLQYMAPEVLSGQRLGLSCDVYSFGVVLYELWSGRQAWETYSEDQIRTNVIGGARPADLERMAEENIPLPIAHLIEACWRARPTDRPTFADMRPILEIEDFWETHPGRWPAFMQPQGGVAFASIISPSKGFDFTDSVPVVGFDL